MSETFQQDRLHTVQVVPLTAFDDQGQLATGPMQALTEQLVDAGVSVLIPCAGSAEFHCLSADEIVQGVEATVRAANGRALVAAPIGGAVHQASELAKRVFDVGAEAVLVMPLSFPYLSDEGARDYYESLLNGLGRPAMIYKKAAIPSDDLLLELAGHPQMAGVKYAVNDIDAFNQIVQRDNGRLDWYCGSAERFAPFFGLAGAVGYTSGAANLCPRLTLGMHAAMNRGDWEETMRLQRLILPIEEYRARRDNSYNVSFLKYAIRSTGLDFGSPRPPNRRLTAAEQREIDQLLAPILEAEKEMQSALV